MMLLSVLLPNEAHAALTLIRDWFEPLECINMLERRLLFPNRLAHAVKLGKAFLLLSNKFIEVLQRADASFLDEELYLCCEFQIVDTSGLPCLLTPVRTTGLA